ncbi:MAG: hypothetical protein FWH21_10100, partial [Kiritimatiellaeota bacterium]|nr:hypothetical protein [Kiritimatiellota bacterium]
ASARYAAWLGDYPNSKLRERASAQYASALWSANRFADAVREGEAFLAAYPKGPFRKPVQETLDRARADLKSQQDRARQVAERKKDTDPLRQTLERAEASLGKKRYTDALNGFLQFQNRQTHPLWGRAWHGYGQTAMALGDTGKALNAWEEVIRRAASFPNTLCATECRHARAGYFFEELAEPAKALPDYLALRDRVPPKKRPDRALEQRIGLVLLALGRGGEAKPVFEALKKAEAADPVRALHWDRLIASCDSPPPVFVAADTSRRAFAVRVAADALFAAEQWKLAEKTYRKALDADIKGNDAAWCEMQRARCLANAGDHRGALTVYDGFKGKYRKSAWASDALLRAGVLCAGPMGNSKKAARYFRDILELCPDGRRAESALLHLATLTWWDREWQEADRLHREFLRKYPETPLKEEFEMFRLPLIAKRKTPFLTSEEAASRERSGKDNGNP